MVEGPAESNRILGKVGHRKAHGLGLRHRHLTQPRLDFRLVVNLTRTEGLHLVQTVHGSLLPIQISHPQTVKTFHELRCIRSAASQTVAHQILRESVAARCKQSRRGHLGARRHGFLFFTHSFFLKIPRVRGIFTFSHSKFYNHARCDQCCVRLEYISPYLSPRDNRTKKPLSFAFCCKIVMTVQK